MSDGRLVKTLEIKNRLGLHARAAARLVQVASQFEAEVSILKDGQVVNGKSILALMMLDAGQGTMIEVTVSGSQAAESMAAIERLIEEKFHED